MALHQRTADVPLAARTQVFAAAAAKERKGDGMAVRARKGDSVTGTDGNLLSLTCDYCVIRGTKAGSPNLSSFLLTVSDDSTCPLNVMDDLKKQFAPWSQDVVLITEPGWKVGHDPSGKVTEFRNHHVYIVEEALGKNLVCKMGEEVCLCNEALNCKKYVLESKYLEIKVHCTTEEDCAVNAYDDGDKDKLVGQDVHYVSCGKCANEIKLDTSPPRKRNLD
uniref:Uncharacterized protein n=1 Tax=Steinernema glaseri TaxID=37863 RepID=A0A1I8A4F0_9BILA